MDDRKTQESPEGKQPDDSPLPPANGTPGEHGPSSFLHDKKRWMWLAIAAVAVLVLGGAYLMMQGDKKTVAPKVALKVGVMLPFSGDSSDTGLGSIKGIELAKRQLGASNIELVKEDSKCDGEAATQAVKNLIAKGVVAIIGEACSGASTAALVEAAKAKIPMVSPTASSPTLSIPDDYFFRVIPPDTIQGKFLSQLIYDKGARSIAIMRDEDTYSVGIADVLTDSFETLGGTVTTKSFANEAVDLEDEAKAVKAANPQAICILVNSLGSAVAAMQLLRDQGVTAPFYGGDALYNKLVITNAKDDAEGLTFSFFSSGSQTFKQDLAAANPGEELTYGAAQAYDAFKAIYQATEAGATTGAAIKDALQNLSFQGVSTKIKFDKNGEISEDYKYDVYVVKDSEFVLEKQ